MVASLEFSCRRGASVEVIPYHVFVFASCGGFLAAVAKPQEDRLLSGVHFGASGPHITHLLFVDDSFVFLEATPSGLAALRTMLQEYEVLTPVC